MQRIQIDYHHNPSAADIKRAGLLICEHIEDLERGVTTVADLARDAEDFRDLVGIRR
jgi:hypothetical protein